MAWRYYATKLSGKGTETLIADDLPLGDVTIEAELSGPGGLTATISPEYASLKGPDGQPILQQWSTAIYAEKDGQIRGCGILVEVEADGPRLSLDCVGFSDYAKGMPYTGNYSKIRVDPLDVVRHIWSHLQSAEQGNIGLEVDDTTSRVRLGKPEAANLTAAKERLAYMDEQLAYTKEQAEQDAILVQQYSDNALVAAGLPKGGLLIRQASAPSGDKRSKRNLWLQGNTDGVMAAYTWNGKKWVETSDAVFQKVSDWYFEWLDEKAVLKDSKAMYTQTKKEHAEAKQRVSDLKDGEAQPYKLTWWETDDLGGVVDELAADTPFEYLVTASGNPDTGITHRLQLGYPGIGRRIPELRFAVGENVTVRPTITIGHEDYADEAIVLGAGEGRDMIRGTWAKRTGRLRRVAVVEAKHLQSRSNAVVHAEREVRLRAPEPSVTDQITVLDHPNAPIGSFNPGDGILLITPDGWTDEARVWYRIVSLTIDPQKNTAVLSLVRAEKVS